MITPERGIVLKLNTKRDLLRKLVENPVIAGLRDSAAVNLALAKGMNVFFILGGSILELESIIKTIKAENDTAAFVHIDLIPGLGKDAAAVNYLAKRMPLDGIVTTRSNLIRAAKDTDLLAIQRLFALDSEAVKTGLNILRSSEPDAVEILPALVLPSLKERLPVDSMPPIIAGGLVETVEEIKAILAGPAVAVSTSRVELWDWSKTGRGT
ncbi:MAG: glycerol-3-phosphate responsive antiterminator [Firmicutes bacterium]|nr:glycerol-3-phosphate responsive antiterminator [Bacillota bacterium]